jgi:NAD+ synthase (glutamine-hydrolysing)
MIHQALDGAEICLNASASHIEEGKLKRKLQMVCELTQKHGGAYLYCNNRGSDGTRLWFDGGCMFSMNGKMNALSPIFSLSNVSLTIVEFSLL